jgi:ubiquinone/menaquinone biosynthesis C-methylase UbiE/intracellular sulfur oxidation DsrE/DsrF family protein
MAYRTLMIVAIGILLWIPQTLATAQEKSVRPGINDSFRDPDPKAFEGRFETESREVFAKRKEIVAACEIKPGQVIADVGAGTGLFTRMFSDAVGKDGRVIAVDISQKFLDHIQQTSRAAGQQNVETRLGTADSANLPAESCDIVFICDTYHHFEFPQKMLAGIRHALKPGGRLILIDFRRIPGHSTEFILNHVRAGQAVVESEIVQAGFLKTREIEQTLQENYFDEFTPSRTPGLSAPKFPLIAGYGGVVEVPNAAEKPRTGTKVVFDCTAEMPPAAVHKGLERAARVLNLYGAAGLKASDVRITLVFHGPATKTVLTDEFYKARFGVEQNPNLPLIRELQKVGVEIFVCGQALNYNGYAASAVAENIPVADAALTVTVNRQSDGYAYLPVP